VGEDSAKLATHQTDAVAKLHLLLSFCQAYVNTSYAERNIFMVVMSFRILIRSLVIQCEKLRFRGLDKPVKLLAVVNANEGNCCALTLTKLIDGTSDIRLQRDIARTCWTGYADSTTTTERKTR